MGTIVKVAGVITQINHPRELTMSVGWCLPLVLAICVQQSWSQNQYCSFTPEHTLCKHKGLGPTCGNQVISQGVSQKDAVIILHQHNQLRSLVARGQEARGAPGPQPPAANMRQMEWDDELAVTAQSHANQCIFEHECGDCRRVSRFGVGQNLFISFQSNFQTKIEWPRAIRAWYDEVAEFSPTAIQPFQFSAGVGHYTAMMWHNTWKMGCGYTMFEEGGWWKKLYTCNYGPAGNIIFSEMYRHGNPCSACPQGTTCSLTYPGLCVPAGGNFEHNNQIARRTSPRTRVQTFTQIPNFRPVQVPSSFIPQVPFNPEQQEFEFEQPEFEAGEFNPAFNFIPMAGAEPRPTDLLPFLQRAGLNTQVIRTNSLANVRSIIESLGANMRPIVLFRSGTGQLTELDAGTLRPLSRFTRSTTTKGPRPKKVSPKVLLTCDMEFSPCDVTPVGGNWTIGETESEGRFAEVILEQGEGAQMVFQKLVNAPSAGSVCVLLTHRRIINQQFTANSTLPELQVGLMPIGHGEKAIRQSVGGAPGMWEMSRKTFKSIKKPFLLMVSMGPTDIPSSVALDALQVTDGSCCMDGTC